MYQKLDLVPDKELDKYMMTFLIPYSLILAVLLWFEFMNALTIAAMIIVFLSGEFYYSMNLEREDRKSALIDDFFVVGLFFTQIILFRWGKGR